MPHPAVVKQYRSGKMGKTAHLTQFIQEILECLKFWINGSLEK
jgi:hypothetical protein